MKNSTFVLFVILQALLGQQTYSETDLIADLGHFCPNFYVDYSIKQYKTKHAKAYSSWTVVIIMSLNDIKLMS